MEYDSDPSAAYRGDDVSRDALSASADAEQPLTADQRGGLLTLGGYLLIVISLLSDFALGMPMWLLVALLLFLVLCLGGSFMGSKVPFVILTGLTALMTILVWPSAGRLKVLFCMEGLLVLGLPIAACVMFWMPSARVFLRNRAQETAEFLRARRDGTLRKSDD